MQSQKFDASSYITLHEQQIREIINNSNKLRGRPTFTGNISGYSEYRALTAAGSEQELAIILRAQVFRFTWVFGKYCGDLEWLNKYSDICARVVKMQIMLDNISHHVYNAEYYYDRKHDNIYTTPGSNIDTIDRIHEVLDVLANPPDFMPPVPLTHDYIPDALSQIWREFGFKSKKL